MAPCWPARSPRCWRSRRGRAAHTPQRRSPRSRAMPRAGDHLGDRIILGTPPLCPVARTDRCLPVRRWLGQAHARARSGPASAGSVAPSWVSPSRRSPTRTTVAYAPSVRSIRIALAQIAPQLGQLDANLARHHEMLERGAGGRGRARRLPGARADRLPAPGPRRPRCRCGSTTRGWPSSRTPPRACRRSSRSSRSRPTTACSSRRPSSRTARSGTSTASCSCRPTACSTSVGSSRPATSCAPCRPASASASGSPSARTSGTSPSRSSWRSTAPRSSSTSRRRRVATSPRPTRSVSGPRRRGGRSCGRTPSSRPRSSSSATASASTNRSRSGAARR